MEPHPLHPFTFYLLIISVFLKTKLKPGNRTANGEEDSEQSLDPEWFPLRKRRLTASNFGLAVNRRNKPTEAFLRNIFQPKDLSNVSSIKHGKQNKSTATTLYANEMQKKSLQFTVYEAGLIVNSSLPYLGTSPDGKVFDPTEKNPFRLLEIDTFCLEKRQFS